MTDRLSPVDRLVAAYNLLLALLWTWHLRQAPNAAWIVAAHVAAMALPVLLIRVQRGACAPLRVLRLGYPLVYLALFWPELDLVRNLLALESFDAAVAGADLALFGIHLHAVWLPNMSDLWFSELMYFSYYIYLPLIFLPPLVMALLRRYAALGDMTFRLMVTYLGCYVIYIMFPVDGPHFLAEPHPGPHTEGLFYQLVEAAHRVSDSRGCSIPSSHVAGAVTIAHLGWRWLPRWVAVLLTAEAAGVVLSTVYTQNHYAVDSVAGLVWALLLQVTVVPGLERWLSAADNTLLAQRRWQPVRSLSDSTGGSS